MDTLRGNFGSADYSGDHDDYDVGDDEIGHEPPPASIGTDERRMQVRAYNHWASLLENRNFPSIEDLEPAELSDFGPFSVLLDFTCGIEDPAIQYLGRELASECGTDVEISQLSDVPSRSLLSRITDHYMQILANQAPIGFEAEFVNQRGATILYRGILLPYSSDGDTIDFIYGVINWKELADQVTTDELLLEIDQALEEDFGEEPQADDRSADPVTDWADGPATEPQAEISGETAAETATNPADAHLDDAFPTPAFGDDDDWDDAAFGAALQDGDMPDRSGSANDDHADADEAVVARLSSLIQSKSPDGASDYGNDEDDALEASDAEAPEPSVTVDDILARKPLQPSADEDAQDDGPDASDWSGEPEASASEPIFEESDPEAGLYDCLAEARELAQQARTSEDRTRHALYAAVGRAYDVCLAAQESPAEFEELIAENGLTMQERAPMTPVVKLVFGADYDKTRLTEYAAVLAHAQRVGIERGQLAGFLGKAEGGLKAVVQAERQLRKEEAGKDTAPATEPRPAIANKLREMDSIALDSLDPEGAEFGLVMIRRMPDGEIRVIGEVSEDIPLVEKVARKLIG